MTEKEKMLSGLPYDTTDSELRKMSNTTKDLMRVYNGIPAENSDLRQEIIEKLLGNISENARVNQPIYVDYGKNISLGAHSLINMNCTLLDTGKIEIGDNTLLAPDVKIYTAVHPIEIKDRFLQNGSLCTYTKSVKIGNNVWIGGNTTILPGVEIGDNTVIGAGSVVTKSIPANVVAYGNPCRVQRYLIEENKNENKG